MSSVLFCLVVSISQGVPAHGVTLDATLGGKPYGTVSYQRSILPGTGREKRVTFDVDDESGKYRLIEARTYKGDGTPIRITRAYSDNSHKFNIVATFAGKNVSVAFDNDVQEFVLSEDKSQILDESQSWFYGSPPKVGATVKFWEFSLDGNVWAERTVKYEGVAKIKFGGKDVNAHRVTIGKDMTLYVDEFGMPYSGTQETAKGKILLTRRVVGA